MTFGACTIAFKRRLWEQVAIGDDVVVAVLEVGPGWVRLGIAAPADVRVDREEVRRLIEAERGSGEAWP